MDDYCVVTEPGTVRLERVLPGPIEHVWAYLTESEKRGKWLASGQIELRVGGRVELAFHHADLSAEKTTPDRYKDAEGYEMRGRVTLRSAASSELHLGRKIWKLRSQLRTHSTRRRRGHGADAPPARGSGDDGERRQRLACPRRHSHRQPPWRRAAALLV